MTVCYDLRFPQLYRALAQAGAAFLTIPAAFTVPTGQAHWHVLLRARAIETGCFVIAPAQCGEHAEGRKTYGHSLIVDPWGEVLADGGEEPGVIVADIDPAKVAEARASIPALTHDRPFSGPAAPTVEALRAAGESSSRPRGGPTRKLEIQGCRILRKSRLPQARRRPSRSTIQRSANSAFDTRCQRPSRQIAASVDKNKMVTYATKVKRDS